MKKSIERKVINKVKSQRKISTFFTTSSVERKNDAKNCCSPKGFSGKRATPDNEENDYQSNSCNGSSNCNNLNTFGTSVNTTEIEFQSKRSKILRSSPVKRENSDQNVQCTTSTAQNDAKLVCGEKSESKHVYISSPKKIKKGFDDVCEEEKENVPIQIDNMENTALVEFVPENDLCSSLFEDNWLFEENLNLACETLDLSSWQHCKILEIQSQTELCGKMIHIECISSKRKTSCLLQDPWDSCRIKVGDFIRIKAIPLKNDNIHWSVNRHSGFFVTNPDNLISGTSVVGSLFCARKGVLSDIFKGIDCDNKIMTIGSLVHELFQNALSLHKTYNINIPFVKNLGEELLKCPSTIAMLYRSQMTVQEASTEIMKFVPKVVQFIYEHIQSTSKNTCENGNVDKVLDIEENLWMPQLGLKGKIDVTLQVKLHDRSKLRVPLELKTGRASFSAEHRGQLILYVMMMRELGHNIKSGLLLYIREGIMKEVIPTEHEIRDLMMLRNEINYFLSRKYIIDKMENSIRPITDLSLCDLELPEPINHHKACATCPYLTLCSTFLCEGKDNKLSENHNLKALSVNALVHLSLNHIQYFKHWVRMLLLEENDQSVKAPNSQIWNVSPEEREISGKTIANLQVEGKVIKNEQKFIHCFKKKSHAEFYTILVPGDYVIISTDKQFNVTTGYVESVTNTLILISIDKDITLNFKLYPFHIDSYESTSLLSFNLTNLGVLLDDTEQSNKLRELIIDKRIPGFTSVISKTVTAHAAKILEKLNGIQQRAVLKVLTAKDYLLIQGMPGTGKTQTVVSIIKLMISLKKSVLITSHTHSAVDNVLLKLHSEGVDFLRLGSMNRIHPDIQSKSDASIISKCSNLEELEQIYNTKMIVGVTCLGSAHALLSRRKFDICIVDESTQVLQCSVLRPLFSADKFVLIGDPEQLPPVVKSKDAKSFGFDESLFNRLSDTGATVMLTIQYRMNSTITNLINKLTYKGLLECADHKVSQSTLNIEKYSEFLECYASETWLCKILNIELENSVKFLDTGNTNLKCLEYANCYRDSELRSINRSSKNGNATYRACSNICEAGIIMYIVNAVIKYGVRPANIGIIAPYRDQVDLIQKLIDRNAEEVDGISEVEVNTVDQYQGRDKDIIIYSCTKSEPPGVDRGSTKVIEREILNDKRRLTVALTRSKQKLIIIGDATTLSNYKPFIELLSFLNSDHIIDLSNADSNFNWNCIFDTMEDSLYDKDVTML